MSSPESPLPGNYRSAGGHTHIILLTTPSVSFELFKMGRFDGEKPSWKNAQEHTQIQRLKNIYIWWSGKASPDSEVTGMVTLSSSQPLPDLRGQVCGEGWVSAPL